MSEATLGCSSFCPHLMSRSHGTVHSPLNGAYHVIQERNDLYKVDFKVENYDFSVSRGRRLEKGREFAISGHQRRIMDTPWLAEEISEDGTTATVTVSIGKSISSNGTTMDSHKIGTVLLSQKMTVDLMKDIPEVIDVRFSQQISTGKADLTAERIAQNLQMTQKLAADIEEEA